MTAGAEKAFVLDLGGDAMVGILHPAAAADGLGVVLPMGGPQYRVGSHRQFVLIARALAGRGHPVVRFDTRGMGDSDGGFPGFEAIDDDQRAAVDALMVRSPAVRRVVLWGLCDAASAILFYAHQDPRIVGGVLVNPWVCTLEGQAKAEVRHYYGGRLASGAFWRKLARDEVAVGASLRSLVGTLARAARGRPSGAPNAPTLPERMAHGFRRFAGPALVALSGKVLTAREFEDATRGPAWQGLLENWRVALHRLPNADHTFSQAAWRAEVIDWTAAFLRDLR
ncbi:MAG: hydrolase 1, exosortase A system-associated [Alphaproteobacteria bacterium]|nr:hydrolase 1, exosortase A system-associated [Alphaproteobacteria bacterium]